MDSARSCSWVAGIALLACSAARAQEPGAAPGAPGAPGVSGEPAGQSELPASTAAEDLLSGFVSTRWIGRRAGDGDDHDLSELLVLDGRLPGTDELELTWRLHAQASADLDGDEDPQSAFYGLSDSYDSDLTGALHEAWLEVKPRASWMQRRGHLRLGRQQLWNTPEFAFFDGLAAETRALDWKQAYFGAYGGVAVHPYESSPAGGAISGLYGELQPWRGGRARLDFMHAEESALLGPERSDLASLALWQHLGERLVLEGSHGRLENEPRDLRAAARWLDAERSLSLEARWYRLLGEETALAVPFDPFESALFALEPYEELGVLGWKGFGERWSLSGGFDQRRLLDDGDESDFNHEYGRAFASLAWQASDATSVSLGGERYETEGDGTGPAEGFSTWSVDLRHELDERWTASAGSAFALYKYDVLDQEEREDARTTWIELRARASEERRLRWRARYEFEDAEDEQFHFLRVEATWEL